MKFKLLITTLYVVWTIVSADEQNCLHDGFYNGTACICKQGFSGDHCQTRTCYNDGLKRSVNRNNDFGCVCPPGFIGTNCQPAKCVDGDSKTFFTEQADQMLSVYITYNLDLRNKTQDDVTGDNPLNVICTAFDNGNYSKMLISTGYQSNGPTITKGVKTCMQQFNDFVQNMCDEDCDDDDDPTCTIPHDCPQSLSPSLLAVSELLDQTTPNSQLFIVTNFNLTDLDSLQSVVRKAVSKRIRIHSLVFTTPGIMDYLDYQNKENLGYQALRTLAESTLGVYSTPYRGTTSQLMGTDGNQKVAATFLNALQGYQAVGMYSSTDPRLQVLNVGSGNDYYISIRSMDKDFTKFFYFSRSPEGLSSTFEVNTGYWRLWKGTTSSATINFIMGASFMSQSNFVIYSKRALAVYPAITTDDSVDASSPFGDVSSGERSFVGKVVLPTNTTLNTKSSFFYQSSGTITFSPADNSSRNGCQFSANLGTIRCNGAGVKFYQLAASDATGSVTPFFCVDKDSFANVDDVIDISLGNSVSEFVFEDAEAPPSCTDNGKTAGNLDESSGKRNFVIISRNAKQEDDNQRPTGDSPVHRLYANKKNIFWYLLQQAQRTGKTNLYDRYVYNLITSGSETNTQYANDPQFFMDDVMDRISSAALVGKNDAVNWTSALSDTVKQLVNLNTVYDEGFSDILLVVDSNDLSNFSDPTLFENLYISRSRLYVLVVENFIPLNASNPQILALSKAAALTGGTLFRFPNYDRLQEFFDIYFFNDNGMSLFQGDVVYQRMPSVASTITTDSIYLPAALSTDTNVNITYTMVVYATSQFPSMTMSVKPNCGTVAGNATFGEATIFSLDFDKKDAECSFVISFVPQAKSVNVIILATQENNLPLPGNAVVGFSESQSTSVSRAVSYFGATFLQYPVMSENVTSLSIRDSSNKEIITLSPQQRSTDNCYGFTSFTNFNFQCTNPNDFYYFLTTFVDGSSKNHTRMFVTQCISKSGGCLNNGQPDSNGGCTCLVGYTGNHCETPICQNGGTVTSANLCNCTDNFSGDFCELSNITCTNSPFIPDTRSEVTSLIFVIERNGAEISSIAGNLPGVQLSVVQYDSDNINVVLAGTDPSKLNAGLSTTAPTNTNASLKAAQALLKGFSMQTTDRAVIIFITKSGYYPTDEERQTIFNKLASQRVDLRVYSVGKPADDLNLLATLGNGIVFVNDIAKFGEYYNNYISKLFVTSLKTPNTIPRLAVEQSGSGPATLTFVGDEADPSTVTYIVHSSKATSVSVAGFATSSVAGSGDSKIDIFTKTISNPPADVIIAIEGSGSIYSIEKLTTGTLGFGFQNDGTNEQLQQGLRSGIVNQMSLYSSRSTNADKLPSMPRISVNSFYLNGTLANDNHLLPTTKKAATCTYNYYSVNIHCDNETLGYSTFINTFTPSGKLRQEQKIFICQKPVASTCANGKLDGGICVCNSGWDGLECDIPLCTSGSSRFGTTCKCLPGFSGPACEKADPPPPVTVSPNAKRAFVFIMDVRMGDQNLFNMSMTSITNFLSMYNSDTLVYFIGNDGSTYAPSAFINNSPNAVRNQLDNFFKNINGTNERQDLKPVFDTILGVVKNAIIQPTKAADLAQSTDYNNLFYSGSTGVVLSNNAPMQELQDNYNFRISTNFFVPSTDFAVPQMSQTTQNTLTNLQENLGPNLLIATNANDALFFMKNEAHGAPYTTPSLPTTRTYSCVKGAQTNINVFPELSNVANIDKYKDQMFNFTNLFSADLEISAGYAFASLGSQTPTGGKDRTGCYVADSRFEGQSMLSGFVFFDNTSVASTISFCNGPGPYRTVQSKIQTVTGSMEFPNWNKSSSYFVSTLKQSCQCSRLNDTQTLNIALWLPVTNGTGFGGVNADAAYFTDTGNVHIVAAFGFAVETDSFYYKLAQLNSNVYGNGANDFADPNDYIISNADQMDMSAVVQKIWTMICRLQGLIGADTTAAPPPAESVAEQELQRVYAKMDSLQMT